MTTPKAMLADKGYEGIAVCENLLLRGILPTISPHKPTDANLPCLTFAATAMCLRPGSLFFWATSHALQGESFAITCSRSISQTGKRCQTGESEAANQAMERAKQQLSRDKYPQVRAALLQQIGEGGHRSPKNIW